MTHRSAAIERFDPARHDVASFNCGNQALNHWLTRSAGQSDRRDAARTFVTFTPAGGVLGYYALLAGQLEHHAATATVRAGQSQYFPIPVAILARLAVNADHQHRGLGAALLRDALIRIQSAAEQIAVRAVIVHAIDDQAIAFYERYGFRALTATPRTLMVTLAELRASAQPSPNH